MKPFGISKYYDFNNFEEEKMDLKKTFLELFDTNHEIKMKYKDNFYKNEINEVKIHYLNLFVDVANFIQSHSKELYYILELYDI